MNSVPWFETIKIYFIRSVVPSIPNKFIAINYYQLIYQSWAVSNRAKLQKSIILYLIFFSFHFYRPIIIKQYRLFFKKKPT